MVEVLLFDLGGVLVEFSGVREVARLLPAGTSESEIIERWSRCPHTEAFCLGQLSRQDFGERFVRDWGIDLAPERFLEEFRSWSKCVFPEAVELLAALRSRFRLAALSNSNELHWERNTRDLGVTDLFEVAISSHQVERDDLDLATDSRPFSAVTRFNSVGVLSSDIVDLFAL